MLCIKSIYAPLRAQSRIAVQMPQVAGPSSRLMALRPFHSTLPALKKRKHTESDQAFDDNSAELESELDSESETESDLFDLSSSQLSATPSTGSGTIDRAATRAGLINSITSISSLPSGERKERVSSELRVGTLRRVFQLTDKGEDVEGLKGVVRAWRRVGMRVTEQTGREIVGRCINLGRPDLAQLFITDKLQYGLPELGPHSQNRLEEALSKYIPTTTLGQSEEQAAA